MSAYGNETLLRRADCNNVPTHYALRGYVLSMFFCIEFRRRTDYSIESVHTPFVDR